MRSTPLTGYRIFALWLVFTLLIPACSFSNSLSSDLAPTATLTVVPSTTATATLTPSPTVTSTSTLTPTPTFTPTPTQTFTPTPEPVARFAVIGDYGAGGQREADVASLVKSWEVEFIITTGDNNYPNGEASTIDQNIGQFYSSYIAPYQGAYGQGAGEDPEENRFFPVLGNHDWLSQGAQPYLDYFELPGNERYYEFTWGPVQFFGLNSDPNEPDGVGASSAQAEWLRLGLAASTTPWQVVFLHAAPYSSGLHGGTDWTRWPYAEWGADAVLAGHDHTYERLQVDGIPYFVNGLGGGDIYNFDVIDPNSQVRFTGEVGAMLVQATSQGITFQFVTSTGEIVDTYKIGQ